MATQLFLLDTVADTHLATDNATLIGANVGWTSRALGLARGSGVVASDAVATVAGTTLGVEVAKTSKLEWITPPVAADVTISGTITANIWGRESANAANVAINVVIEIIRANVTATRNSNTLVLIVKSTRVTEMAISATTNSVSNFTTGMASGGYTGQTLNRGDRLRIRVFGDDAGTMGSGQTFQIGYSGTTAAANGDSYVTLTENLTFESAPAGSTLYLTDTTSAVSTASTDYEAWTSRGVTGVKQAVVSTAAGWTAPIQLTQIAGGTVLDWFTRPLTAVTLTGMAVANLRARESNAAANASIRCEIARVEGDGTSPTVWASWCIAPITNDGELGTTEAAQTANISGDDLAITSGQRLRIRVYADDMSSAAMTTANTVTVFYEGNSGGATGDSYITLSQTVTEFSGAPGPSQSYRFLRANRFLTSR